MTPRLGLAAAAGSPIADSLLEWPPDVFALTEVILEHAEAYRFVVSPPPGHEWPPPAIPEWSRTAVAVGAAWAVWAREHEGPLPELIAGALGGRADCRGDAIGVASRKEVDWPVCEALLTLHAVADEACAGMGVAVVGADAEGCAVRGRGRELLARTGSLARVGQARHQGTAQGAYPGRRHLAAVALSVRLRARSRRRRGMAQGAGAAFGSRPPPPARQRPAVAVAAAGQGQRLPAAAGVGAARRSGAVRVLRLRPGRTGRSRSRRSTARRGAGRGRRRRHGGPAGERRARGRDRRRSRRSCPATGWACWWPECEIERRRRTACLATGCTSASSWAAVGGTTVRTSTIAGRSTRVRCCSTTSAAPCIPACAGGRRWRSLAVRSSSSSSAEGSRSSPWSARTWPDSTPSPTCSGRLARRS